MRLLQLNDIGNVSLTKDLADNTPYYAILSHTWGADDDEVTFKDLSEGLGDDKIGYKKIRFCGEQARRDGITYFWVDTCCIDRSSHTELSEAITSMFRWYREAVKCYVYLTDVTTKLSDCQSITVPSWEAEFRKSRWFTRGWTLQELLAPSEVEFYTWDQQLLGGKKTLIRLIHEITDIPISALYGTELSQFPQKERMRWAIRRETKKPEDRAYCLLGIFEVFMPLIYGEGNNAFVRLEKTIAEYHGTLVDAAHTHWLVPYSSQPLFTGRKLVLQELESTIRETVYAPKSDGLCRIVISGIGGQGKSEICLQLAHRLRHIFWAVLWIDISSTEAVERSFLEIARLLSLPCKTWQEARSTIANFKHPWLLILDNADDPDIDYHNYFAESPIGVVLMTTRNEECQQYAMTRIVELGGLDDDDACDLLLKACRIPLTGSDQFQEDARKVASLLQTHALALIQAGSYVARGHCSLASYPEVYRQQRQRLMKFRPRQARSRYQDVYTTFEVSITALKAIQTEAAQDALSLLPLQSVCAPHRLALFLLFEGAYETAKNVLAKTKGPAEADDEISFTSWHAAKLLSSIDMVDNDDHRYRLVEAVALLKAFCLVAVEGSGTSAFVSVHPLVHAWAWDRQSNEEQHRSWVQMGCLLAFATRYSKITPADNRQLQSHVEALTEWPVDIMFATEVPLHVAVILAQCGWFLRVMRADGKLVDTLHKVFTGLGLDDFKVDSKYTGLYVLRGSSLMYSGQTESSLLLLQEVVRIRQHSLPHHHRARSNSEYELAVAYRANGQVAESIALLEEVVKAERLLPLSDYSNHLVSQQELANSYLDNGQVKEAVALHEEVCSMWGRLTPEDWPLRLTAQDGLAGAYLENGQVRKAVELLTEVVTIQARLFEEDHPNRLASQHQLARAYQANGQMEEAVALLKKVVRVWENSVGKNHPHRLTSMLALGSAYEANGQVKQAVAILEEVHQLYQSLPSDHPDRQSLLHTLAGVYQANGQLEEALVLLEDVVKMRQSLPEDHPNRIASEHALALAYKDDGRISQAIALLEKLVEIQMQKRAEDHRNLLASQHVLAGAYRDNGQLQNSIVLLEHVVKMQERSFAKDHPERLRSLQSLAVGYDANGQAEQAVALLEQVLQVRQSLAQGHPDLLSTKHALAVAYRATGQFDQAIVLLEDNIRLESGSLAETNPNYLSSRHTLAVLYHANGQLEQAAVLLEDVVKIRRAILAVNHPTLLASQHALAGVYKEAGKAAEAVLLLEQVVRLKDECMPKPHPSRLMSFALLPSCLWLLAKNERPLMMMREVVDLSKIAFRDGHPHQLLYKGELDRMESESLVVQDDFDHK